MDQQRQLGGRNLVNNDCNVWTRAVLRLYGHFMVLYKPKFKWVTWSPPTYVIPIMFS